MRRAILQVLPGLSLLCGCSALDRPAEVVDYHPGGAAIITAAKEDASFDLYAPYARKSWTKTDVQRGAAVGFRREPNGTVVAFAGEQSWPVDDADGRHVWLTPKRLTGCEKILVGARDKSQLCLMYLTLPIWGPFFAAGDM